MVVRLLSLGQNAARIRTNGVNVTLGSDEESAHIVHANKTVDGVTVGIVLSSSKALDSVDVGNTGVGDAFIRLLQAVVVAYGVGDVIDVRLGSGGLLHVKGQARGSKVRYTAANVADVGVLAVFISLCGVGASAPNLDQLVLFRSRKAGEEVTAKGIELEVAVFRCRARCVSNTPVIALGADVHEAGLNEEVVGLRPVPTAFDSDTLVAGVDNVCSGRRAGVQAAAVCLLIRGRAPLFGGIQGEVVADVGDRYLVKPLRAALSGGIVNGAFRVILVREGCEVACQGDIRVGGGRAVFGAHIPLVVFGGVLDLSFRSGNGYSRKARYQKRGQQKKAK